ncbi:nucleoside hydrolase [Prauserella cavernicola]|uniref:Nucleoside hydrolase n=1 Tax=Prauserella cavernicola TaxID=2800127 RepID=A0A934V7S3_9PSEU|nr:nucleoside hydrolase [Prauserella cavernicola]MBK1787540.1 nucleoside hydrolase [Prauserella cavernicola]
MAVDQDGGVDDAFALALLAADPRAALVAVGSVHGNVEAERAARSAARVLDLAGEHSTPVACGAARPLVQPLRLAHPRDPLGALIGSSSARVPADVDAVGQLLAAARTHSGRLSVLTLGPLTNLAMALQRAPRLPHLVHRVVVMGGAHRISGNATATAESNIWHDPDAAEIVLGAGFANLTLVPLDLTREGTAVRLGLHHLAASGGLRGRVGRSLLAHRSRLPAFAIHDALAAAILLDPHLATYEHRGLRVLLEGEHRGRIVPADPVSRLPVAIARDADLSGLGIRLCRALRGPVAARWRERGSGAAGKSVR